MGLPMLQEAHAKKGEEPTCCPADLRGREQHRWGANTSERSRVSQGWGWGWDQLAVKYWGPVVTALTDRLDPFWVVSGLSFTVGAALALWIDSLFRRRGTEPAPPVAAPRPRPDTRLRLRLGPTGSRYYLQEASSNIEHWQQALVSMQGQTNIGKEPLFHNDTLVVTFTEEVDYDRPIIDSFGHELGGYNFFPLGRKAAMFQFFGDNQAPMVEIWFPPPDYYAEKSARP